MKQENKVVFKNSPQRLLKKTMLGIMKADRAYANRADKDLGGLGETAQSLGGTSISSLLNNKNLGLPADANFLERAAVETMRGGVLATNLGYRYGLPAAGLTLAGKALYDLTQSYQTAGTLQPE